jgi:SRSO17 transposase
VVAHWPAQQWERHRVAEGEKGPRVYDWGRARVIESRHGLPEIAYYLALVPEEVPLAQLAKVAATRYTVEQCIEESKGETGLDHYEVRHWHSWYRHITLAMMAHAWLASIRSLQEAQKGE